MSSARATSESIKPDPSQDAAVKGTAGAIKEFIAHDPEFPTSERTIFVTDAFATNAPFGPLPGAHLSRLCH